MCSLGSVRMCVCVCIVGTAVVTMELDEGGVFVDEKHSSVCLTHVCVCDNQFSTGKHHASI